MNQTVFNEVVEKLQSCTCGGHHPIQFDQIIVEEGALAKVAPYLGEKGFVRPVIITDEPTFGAAGERLAAFLQEAGNSSSVCILEKNAALDVVADEASIVQAMLAAAPGTDVLLAVGSGTIHDVTRFAAFKLSLPFVSIPTAASVDGFTSAGAPVILRGTKTTVQTVPPVALFADLTVLVQAPRELAAAGFGDMLGKCTSLADWRVSHLLADEPYCSLAESITRASLERCHANIELIRSHSSDGIKILLEALIISGLVMLSLDHSRPASGGEHHLSHYWEMAFLREQKPQILHGAKVGAATVVIAKLYQQLAAELGPKDAERLPEQFRERYQSRWKEIAAALRDVPDPAELIVWLRTAGAGTAPSELGVHDDLLQESIQRADRIRPRHTGLWLRNRLNSGT
ncbi:sn-glycerol-1-phosphate dehydrogenase [Paenibacillus turpanensis]|uniref:sn-glycerol-1-phosphate dehydrogenase n=1 Tax=Paenibacillus turpanensis TaxID=2689078 RepID=UPI001407E18B|nr:sn-glycerol-1-phosphate dehydrogenase [Paenibacillus turpanensis]